MKKIKKLPPHLIAQIAAGEVIERPSYAVKELVDNALDAGATEISIQLEQSGLKKIIVADNGVGMNKEDLFECFKIHTTSKVENEESLTAISSMGFRGEALASIAAISHLIIKSKTAVDIGGHFIEIQNVQVIKDGPVGMPKGTSIEIANIFAPVPARKKFLKSATTELRHIIDVFISFALTFPEIRFSLSHNQKILYDLAPVKDLFERATVLLNESVVQHFIPLDHQDSYMQISGFLAKPQVTTQTSAKQYLFVNNRRITDKLISQAIRDSFSSLIPQKQQPVFLLFITIPFELVDVNVHPRKEQIAFYNNQLMYDLVSQAVSETLQQHSLTFDHLSFSRDPITKSMTGDLLRQSTTPWQVKNELLQIDYQTMQQLHKLYLFVQTKNGVLVVDQHAGHERILFEQFKEEFMQQKIKKQKLKTPITLSLTAQEKLLVEEFYLELGNIGFVIDLDANSISEIPVIFVDRNLKELLKELLENLEEFQGLAKVDQVSLKILQFLACKNAVKSGDVLEKDEAIKLVKKLEQTTNNYTCPHGRPTKYLFSLNELNKLFKRF